MSFDQIPFAAEFVDNPEPRCPCLLLLDTSSSMQGAPIAELNNGLETFTEQLATDSLAMKRVEIAVVSFGPVQVQSEFTSAAQFRPPALKANGVTPMGAAVEAGLDLVDSRKEIYRAQGVQYYRPWIFLITDGAPTDNTSVAAARVREGAAQNAFSFFAVGVEGADMQALSEICVREPLRLRGLGFGQLFTWLSNSMSSVSRSRTDEQVSLENPAAPNGWAFV